jgi:hypothetical protein
MSRPRVASWLGVILGGVGGLLSCVTAPSDPRFVVEQPPDRASFPVVSALLEHRCGTLDCHGVTFRNLRVYSGVGLRLSPQDRPTSKASSTTAAELDANFESLVTLEPEIISRVVADGGAHPERLSFLRKARGTEDHKGLALWKEGDPEDVCVTSWLAGKTEAATCQKALVAR